MCNDNDPKELGIQVTITDQDIVETLLPMHKRIEEHFKETGERSAIFAQVYFFDRTVPPDPITFIRMSARVIVGQENFKKLEECLDDLAEKGAWNRQPAEQYNE